MIDHSEHTLFYVVDKCVAQAACYMDENGDVVLTEDFTVVDIDGECGVYCQECDRRLSMDDGLAIDWVAQ